MEKLQIIFLLLIVVFTLTVILTACKTNFKTGLKIGVRSGYYLYWHRGNLQLISIYDSLDISSSFSIEYKGVVTTELKRRDTTIKKESVSY